MILRRFPLAASSLVLAVTLSFAADARAEERPAAEVPAGAPSPPEPEPRDMAADLDRELEAIQSRPSGLTADRVAVRAVEKSYELSAQTQRERAAAAEVEVAEIRYAPRLNLSASYMRLSPIDAPTLGTIVVAPGAQPGLLNPTSQPLVAAPFRFPVLLNQTQLRAQLVVPLTDYFLRFPQLLTAAQSGKGAAEFNRVAQRNKTITEAKLAYYSWARAVLEHVTARQAHERTVSHLADTHRLFSAGLATTVDLRAVEAQVAQAELLEIRAESLVIISAEQLRTQMQLPPGAPLEIGDRVTEEPALPPTPTLEQAWIESQRTRPELLALGQTEQQLLSQADALIGSELPRVDAVGELVTANPNPRYQPPLDEFRTTWAVGVQASWTVNDWPSNAAARKGVLAQASTIASQRNAMKQALRSEIVASLRGVEQAKATIESAERGVSAAQTAYRVRRDLYLAGRARSVELTDAETDLTRARIDYIDALIDARIALVRLDHALGRVSIHTGR